MRIWLIKAGEPLPIDDDNPRLLRTGLMFQNLSDFHEVEWLTEAFNHQHKRFRSEIDSAIQTTDNSRIVLLKTVGYSKNISVGRLIDDFHFALKLDAYFKTNSLPNCVVCSYPLIVTAFVTVLNCRRYDIPVMVDVRDLWPDIFSIAPTGVTKLAGRIVEVVLAPLVRYIFRHATRVIGITEGMVEWACKKGNRTKTNEDMTFPLGFIPLNLTERQFQQYSEFWYQNGIKPEDKIISYIGSYIGLTNNKVDLKTVLQGFVRANFDENVKLVIAGESDELDSLKSRFGENRNIIFPGWLNKYQLSTLLSMSIAGLAPYKTRLDFSLSIPNKIIEYLSYGLPVVAALDGEITSLIDKHECGYRYQEGNSESFCQVLCEIVNNFGEREKRSAKAREVYRTHFDGEKISSAIRTHIEQYARHKKVVT